MSEYTPTTEKVRIYYANDGLEEERLREEVYLLRQAKLEKEFDRWLAQHDAEVAAAERERIIDILRNISPGSGVMGDDLELAVELIEEKDS